MAAEKFWSAERVSTLEAGFAEGLSWSQVATKVGDGCNLNMALSKGYRLGLKRGGDAKTSRRMHQPATVFGFKKRSDPKLYTDVETIISKHVAARVWPVTAESCTLLELKDNQCHWPVGLVTGAEQTFCGQRRDVGGSYCRRCREERLKGSGDQAGEPLRSQMLNGDFLAGVEDDRWQVIPTSWVDAAMKRWKPREQKGPMDSLGVDVSRGGRDETTIARRHAAWFDEMIANPGAQTPDGPAVFGQVMAVRRDRAPVHIDIVGWGSSPYDFMVQNRVQVIGINGASKSWGRTKDGQLSFINLRAELWWAMREALDPTADVPLSLPPAPKLKADLCAPRWRLAAGGIQVEAKEDIIKRLGRSPDYGDAAVMALVSTVKDEVYEAQRINGQGNDYDPFAALG